MGAESSNLIEVQLAWVNLQGQPGLEIHHMPVGTTVGELIERSQIAQRHPELDPGPRRVALHGRLVSLAARLEEGDRVELAPSLMVDPMASRRRRAAIKAGKQGQTP